MARFNTETVGTKTVNFAGGESFKESPELELVSILLTSFVQDQFYRKAGDTIARVGELLNRVDPLFAAKASIYARREFGMRSITHVVGGEIASKVKGQTWTKNYFRQLFKRPDDMLEVVSYFTSRYGIHPLPNSLKKAIRESLTKLDAYSLAKYRGEGKAIKMVDLVNLTHPKETAAIKKLVNGELKSTETWETKLTQAGQQAESEEEKGELKKEAWASLLKEKKLGYFALLRNLRNILEQAPDLVPLACEQLVNREAIKKSLVLPFRFMTALEQITERKIVEAISDALDIAVENCPELPGKTAIVLDESGSMDGRPWAIGSLFASVLYKRNDADLLLFADRARFVTVNSRDSVAGIQHRIGSQRVSGGTNFHSIFAELGFKKYDRVIILSDMQGWVGHYAPTSAFNEYCRRASVKPFVYSFDLQGYGTLQFPEKNVFCLAGFSDKIFDVMKLLETDKNALVKTIKGVNIDG